MSTLKIDFKKSKWYFRKINVVTLCQIKREQLKGKRDIGRYFHEYRYRNPKIGTYVVKSKREPRNVLKNDFKRLYDRLLI